MSTPDFYRNVRAYDIAFGDRDFPAECDFLEWCLHEHGGKGIGGWALGIREAGAGLDASHSDCLAPSPQPPTPSPQSPSFLELACGPARHAREFARRGWRAIGLDMSTDMLTYATQSAAQEGTSIEPVCADMCDFTLRQPVALVANMMESLSHLVANAQVVSHLRAVSRNLLPGGIYVIEMAHPSTIWRDNLPNRWTSVADGMTIDVTFGLQDDPYDWITQQWTVTTRLTIHEAGQPARVIEHHNNHRWYQVQELAALIDLSCAFERVWWYGNLLIPPPPLDNTDGAERMIVVLRK